MRHDSETGSAIVKVTNQVNRYYDLELDAATVREMINAYLSVVRELLEVHEPKSINIPKLGKIVQIPDKLERIKAITNSRSLFEPPVDGASKE